MFIYITYAIFDNMFVLVVFIAMGDHWFILMQYLKQGWVIPPSFIQGGSLVYYHAIFETVLSDPPF